MIITPNALLTDLATVILMLRDQPEARDEQKVAFRNLVHSLGPGDLAVTVEPRGFLVRQDPVALGSDPLRALHGHLRALGVGEIRFPAGLMTSTLLSFIRAIGVPASTYGTFDHFVARLDAAGAGVIQVSPIDPTVEAEATAATAVEPSGGEGALDALGPDALSEAQVGLMHFATLELHAINPLKETMDRLQTETTAQGSSDVLNELVAAAEIAARHSEWVHLLRAAHSLIELEAKGGETAEHRGYGIALRRMLPRSALERVARLVAMGQYKTEAVAVMRRMGADATEVLLHQLATATEAPERRAYFNALKEMTEGTNLLVHMLSHDEWYVVRNVADLCGELRLEDAVLPLAKRMKHSDERVRRSVAGALAKIGGASATEPLRQALQDPSAAVRLFTAMSLDGRKSRGLAMTLAMAAEEESKADIQREMYLALGRVGSPDAIQSLLKAAMPGGKLFKRRSISARLAAVEGLHGVGPSAANALKSLLQDPEKAIREAAEKALADLW